MATTETKAVAKRAGEGEVLYGETARRVRRAERLIAKQYATLEINRILCTEFGVVERTAYTYLKIAYERLAADAVNDRAVRKAQMRLTMRSLVRDHMRAGDRTAANYLLDKLCKLDGLYAPEKIINIDATMSVAMQIDQVIEVLDDAGVAALEIVLAQLERAGIKALPPGEHQPDDAPLALPDDSAEATAERARQVPVPEKRPRGSKRKAP